MLPGGIGPWELVIVLAIVLLIFGGSKLSGVGKSLGQGIREFKEALTHSSEDEAPADDNPPTPKSE